MVQVIRNLYLQKGDKFAQLLLLPYIKPQKTSTTTRMGGGFGSTNITAGLTTLLQELEKPILRLTIRGQNFEDMLDTEYLSPLYAALNGPQNGPYDQLLIE